MTSQDVRDIMSISTPSAGSGLGLGQPAPRRGPQPREKRPDGITRELYALIGDNAPSLALAQATKPKFKERIKRTGPAVHWQLSTFTNPSRGAGKPESEDKAEEARKKLKLSHWVRDQPKDHVEGSVDTKFAKFNTSSQPYSYTDEEYGKWLTDETWSKEDTDHLFELAHKFDLRFIVMADRWERSPERGVDALKHRYYTVCRTLVNSRPRPEYATPEEKEKADKVRQETLASFHFDLNRETERKAYLKSLLSRTPSQIAEEDFLYVESRRLEQSYNKIASERAELLKILGGREGIGSSGGMQVGVGGGVKGAALGLKEAERKRKGQTGWEIEGLNGGGLPEGWAGEGSKRKATAAQDAANCIERHPAPSVSAPKASPYPSVSVRSSRLQPVKPGASARVSAALTELGLSTHLVMPTRTNIEKLDQLQAALAQMVELKKAVDRVQGEIRMVKKKKEQLLGTTTPAVEEEGAEEEVVKKEEGEETASAAASASARADRETSIRNKRSASASSTSTNKRARH